MATVWTKTTVQESEWLNDYGLAGEALLDEEGIEVLGEDSENILEEGYITEYVESEIASNSWDPFGPLLYLATEGYRERLMTEGELDYIVVAKPGIWVEVEIESNLWTKETID
jgi:hypothetical protein